MPHLGGDSEHPVQAPRPTNSARVSGEGSGVGGNHVCRWLTPTSESGPQTKTATYELTMVAAAKLTNP